MGRFAQALRHLGDAFGVVAHALQLGDHLEDGSHLPQVAGHRLLRSDQDQDVVLNREAFLVDQVVVAVYFPRNFHVLPA